MKHCEKRNYFFLWSACRQLTSDVGSQTIRRAGFKPQGLSTLTPGSLQKFPSLKHSSSPPLHCSFNFLLFALLTFYIFWHQEENKLHFLDHFCFNQPTVWNAGGKAFSFSGTENENEIPLTLKGSWQKGLRRGGKRGGEGEGELL